MGTVTVTCVSIQISFVRCEYCTALSRLHERKAVHNGKALSSAIHNKLDICCNTDVLVILYVVRGADRAVYFLPSNGSYPSFKSHTFENLTDFYSTFCWNMSTSQSGEHRARNPPTHTLAIVPVLSGHSLLDIIRYSI
jgi:hypothetical protein